MARKIEEKPVRYWIRDEIEEIIKEENIDRNRFYEFSKFDYTNIIKRFYYAFANYEQYPKIELSYCWLHFRENLHPGEGRIDYEKLFENLKRSNYAETVTIESTSVLPDGSIDYDKLNGSLDYLHGLMA